MNKLTNKVPLVVLAKEPGPRTIRVNSINPGMVETEGVHATGFIGSDFQKQSEAQTRPRSAALRSRMTSRRLPFSWRPRIQDG